ncbi:MAG: zinc ribbon domain-containing protein, partial [Cellulosimicrobium cellulans]
FACKHCGHTIDRDLNAAVNLATWGEQHHSQVLDPEARGQVTNAHRREGSGPRTHADETSPDDVGTLTATAAQGRPRTTLPNTSPRLFDRL